MPKAVKKEKTSYTSSVPAVDEASRILICLAENSPSRMNLTDICKAVDIHKSKGFSILNTLQKYGFVQKGPEEKTYSLGPGLISLSRSVLDNLDYRETISPFLETLARDTGSTALFGIINGNSLFVIAKYEGSQSIGVTIRLGHRFHITAGAHGKAIVAFMPEKERNKILERDRLFFHGDSSMLDRPRLNEELMQCRTTGYSIDIGELSPGITAVASPVFNSQDSLIGALFVIGIFREPQIAEYGRMVALNAIQVSRMLGADIEKTYRIIAETGKEAI